MPDSYNGSPQSVEQLKQNIARSGIVGSLVANDFKSSMIFVPLLDKEPGTGKRIDYHGLSQAAGGEDPRQIRAGAEPRAGAREGEPPQIKVHVIGFAKLIGELIDGLLQGHGVLRHRGAHRHRDHLRLHALRAQHGAGHRLLAGRRRVAARPGRAARLRARPVLDPGAVPGVRDRRVARRAEDERHHAGHRPRHASSWSPRATRSAGCSWPA